MKRTFFLLIMVAGIMTSCSSNESAGITSVSKATTASISAYITNNYPDTKIYTTTTSGSTLIATLNTGEQLSFSADGTLISYTNNSSLGLKADSLVVTKDSIPTDSLDRPGHGGKGHGGPDGRGGRGGFGGNKGGGPGYDRPDGPGYGGPVDTTHVAGDKPGEDRHFKNDIVVDSLPAVINTYISTNYASYTVIHAEIDTICQGAVTEVMVCTKTAEPVKLVFDAADAYLFKAERILYTDVPTTVSAAVTSAYSTYTVAKRAEKITLADGSLQYKVFVSLDKIRKAVTYNADGILVCEK